MESIDDIILKINRLIKADRCKEWCKDVVVGRTARTVNQQLITTQSDYNRYKARPAVTPSNSERVLKSGPRRTLSPLYWVSYVFCNTLTAGVHSQALFSWQDEVT
jgi:hypothetical protein